MINILIVEDDLALADVYKIALAKENYSVIHSDSCREAINILNKQDIELVILDMNLPDAPGTQVLDFIESEPALTTVSTIVLTGFTRFVNQASRPCVLQTLNKPVTAKMLARTVKMALASSL